MQLSAARALQDRLPSAGPGARRILAFGAVLLAGGGSRLMAVRDSVRITLDVPATARAGDAVPMTIRITNIADRPVTLSLVGREIAFDLVVAGEGGTVVWRRLAHAAIQGILQLKTLQPGETLELRHEWNQHTDAGVAVAPAVYHVLGEVPTEVPRQSLRTPVRFLRIQPR
jgi:intracellular proteinase inhibitor BsuPI